MLRVGALRAKLVVYQSWHLLSASILLFLSIILYTAKLRYASRLALGTAPMGHCCVYVSSVYVSSEFTRHAIRDTD